MTSESGSTFDPFSENQQQHEAFKQSARDAAQRLMLVALDEELPLPVLSKATNTIAPLCRSLLRHKRTPAKLFVTASFLIRTTVRAQRSLRAALLRFIHLRRAQIDSCIQEWEKLEYSGTTQVNFLEFSAVFVKSSMKRRVVVAHRLACCHSFVRSRRQFKPIFEDSMSTFYQRAFAVRTVSSRSCRIVRSFVEALVLRRTTGFGFELSTIAGLVLTCARITYLPHRMRHLGTSEIAQLDDNQLRRVSRAVAVCNATESSPGACDAVAMALDDWDDQVMASWLGHRRQQQDDLPDRALSSGRLLDFAGQRVVPTAVCEHTRKKIAAMNGIFRTTKRRGMLALRQRSVEVQPAAQVADGASGVSSALERELANRIEAKAEHERLRKLAAELAAKEAFERKVNLVGDAWIEEPFWSSDVTLNGAYGDGMPRPSALQTLIRGLRTVRWETSARLTHLRQERDRVFAADQRARANTRLRCPDPPRQLPGRPHSSSLRKKPVPTASEDGPVVLTTRRSRVSVSVRGPSEQVSIVVKPQQLHRRGASVPFPALNRLTADVRPPKPPQPSRVIANGRVRALTNTGRGQLRATPTHVQ